VGQFQRRRFLVLAGAFLARPPAQAQPAVSTAGIGFLIPFTRRGFESRLAAFRSGLREFGYDEGRNLSIEMRSPEGRTQLLPALASELVALKLDVLVTGGTRATQALKNATATIPIVTANVGDAVATGLVASLARPSGNLTGSTFFIQDLYVKRLELLKETLPHLSRAAVLIDPTNIAIVTNIKKMEAASKAMRIELHRFEAKTPEDFEQAFAAMSQKRARAVTVVESPMLTPNVSKSAALAAKYQLPSSGPVEFGDAGGMIGYGVDALALYRRAAYFVDKILKGARPADLPMEQPTKFELVINAKTASALGIAIARNILLRADRIIE
jgi:putative tryptophan/tyrosine transport system substrate-binding protein